VDFHFYGPNADGVHLSSCVDVTIADCDFVCGDDAISIDCDGGLGASERIVIRDCEFLTRVNAVRLYTGLEPWTTGDAPLAGVHSVEVENLVIHKAVSVLNIVAQRGVIDDVSVRRVSGRMAIGGVPVFIMTDAGAVRRIEVADVHVVAANGIVVVSGAGSADDEINTVRISDSSFSLVPIEKKFGLGYPDPIKSYSDTWFGPYNIYIRHAESVEFVNLCLTW
jgi:polygalacturonase